MNIKEYIRQKIKEYDPTVDTSTGSPVGDLFINPLSSILADTLEFKDYVLNNLSLENVESMTEEEMDAIAENFLVYRNQGELATGSVRLYYSSPVNVSVPKGTLFSNDEGRHYVTSSNFSITSERMARNLEAYPLYHTGDIPIESVEAKIEYTTKANTIKNLLTPLNPEPVSVRNLFAVISREDKESNQQLKNKILSSFTNKSLAAPDSIKRTLKENFSTIESLTVVSAGDGRMLRDINYDRAAVEDVFVSDFYAKISGFSEFPNNQSLAYGNRFNISFPVVSGEVLPLPEEALPRPEDFTYEFTTTMYGKIYSPISPSYAEVSNILLSENFDSEETDTGYNRYWILGDGREGQDKTNKEIKAIGGAIKMGSVENSSSPVMQIPLSKHVGVRVTGEFKTNDSTKEGEMSYITLKRNNNLSIPYDGYGIAWRKGDADKYNVYIVDNDALKTDTYIDELQVLEQSGGVNRFLAAGKKQISTGTWYKFVMDVHSHGGIDVWIYEADSFPATTPENRTVYVGQSYPPYAPQASGNHFGIGVIETKNSAWWYRSLAVIDTSQSYPMHLFKIKCKPEHFKAGLPTTLTYYGAGLGDIKWFVRNIATDRWELAGENNLGWEERTLNELKMVKTLHSINNYRDDFQFVNVLATPYNYLDDDHELRSYYISATNSMLSGVHSGNHVDIYINDKSNVEYGIQSVYLDDLSLSLGSIENFNFPVVDVESVTKTITGSLLVENEDYVIVRPNEGTAFSEKDSIKIVFADEHLNTQVNINYRYYVDGDDVQDLMESDVYRYPGQDNLVKVYPYSVVKIPRFRYGGAVDEEVVEGALINHINGLVPGEALEISDLINAAYTAGADYVDTLNISVRVKVQDFKGTYFEKDVKDSYTLPPGGVGAFFADTYSVYGVTKVE